MKEAVKVRALVSMDALVQQTESPFTAEVLHFPLLTKFKMLQIEAFDGLKDPIELHGYQDPVRCRAFAITLKGSALAWFNRLSPALVSSFMLPPADRKARPSRKHEVLRPEVQLKVIKGGHPE